MSKNKFYVTTPIYYPSGIPHIGTSYTTIAADVVARYKRLQGYDVMFTTGTDEHGQKIETSALKEGKLPQKYVDGIVEHFKNLWNLLGISYNKFVRTTDLSHKKSVQKIFKKLYNSGKIYKGKYKGWYCTPDEAFFTDTQLVDGKCPDCGREVTWAEEEAYFFKLSEYADKLLEYYENHPNFIQPESRKNEMIQFIKSGLDDLCVSRTSFNWGIPVDFDDKHIVYVWLDALTNYITGLGYDVDGENGELYKKYWPADLHLIGKDIIRFHTIYWPIFLMSLDLPLPKQVFGHPWLLMADGKMSKSKGNVLYADTLADFFGVDAVRYFVLHEMPFDNDGSISWELMVERYNSDLANILGNLVSRTISMSNKYFGGIVETNDASEEPDEDLINTVLDCAEKAEKKMDELRVADAITEIFNIFRRSNKYIDETMPWALAKDEDKKERLKTVLYNLTESITIGASLLTSFMPETAEKILKELNTEKRAVWDMDTFGLYPNGNKVTEKPEMLFARLDLNEVMKKVEEMMPKASDNEAKAETADDSADESAPLTHKELIEYDDFAKLELRIGEIIACEEVPKSKKLLKETIKLGSETRTVLSGIKKWYKPEDMVGKKVLVVCNLAPRKIAGIESQGMVLAAEDESGEMLSLLTPDNKDMPSGAEVC